MDYLKLLELIKNLPITALCGMGIGAFIFIFSLIFGIKATSEKQESSVNIHVKNSSPTVLQHVPTHELVNAPPISKVTSQTPIRYMHIDDFLQELRIKLDDPVFSKREEWIDSIIGKEIVLDEAIIDNIETIPQGKGVTLKGKKSHFSDGIEPSFANAPYVFPIFTK